MKAKNHIPPPLPQNAPHPTPVPEKDISVHRAFLYGAGAPGLGQYYAGRRLRGVATAVVFVFFCAWFSWRLFEIMGGIMSRIFGSLNQMTPLALPQISFISLAVAFFGMYFIWLWAMLDAVDVAAAHRRQTSAPSQTSAFWATAISWFCPGAGQVYTAERRFGHLVFAVYFLAILLTVPAYVHLVQHMVELVKSGQLSPDRPLEVVDIIHGLITRTNYSFGKLLQAFLRCFAVAAAIDALARGPLQTDTRWSRPSTANALALAGLGWLCPGAAQLLQARRQPGWIIFAAYIASRALIGLLLATDLITVAQVDRAAWIPVVLQWGAMAEAVVWMMAHRRRQSIH